MGAPIGHGALSPYAADPDREVDRRQPTTEAARDQRQ